MSLKKSVKSNKNNHKNTEDIVQDYLLNNVLYHVYVRNEDSYLDPENKKHHDIILLKTFVKIDDAKKWIFKNGKECIEYWDDNASNGPFILMIMDINHSSDDDFETPLINGFA